MNDSDRTVVNQLVSELGRAVTAVHAADQEAPDEPNLDDAHGRLAEATGLIVELARGMVADAAIVARACAAIAAAQDAVGKARAAVNRAREHQEANTTLRHDAAEQARRVRTQAARIRWSRKVSRRPRDD
jgi:hypothetical protein